MQKMKLMKNKKNICNKKFHERYLYLQQPILRRGPARVISLLHVKGIRCTNGQFDMSGKILKTIYFLKGNNGIKFNTLWARKTKRNNYWGINCHFSLYNLYKIHKSFTVYFWALRVIYPFSAHQDLTENV